MLSITLYRGRVPNYAALWMKRNSNLKVLVGEGRNSGVEEVRQGHHHGQTLHPSIVLMHHVHVFYLLPEIVPILEEKKKDDGDKMPVPVEKQMTQVTGEKSDHFYHLSLISASSKTLNQRNLNITTAARQRLMNKFPLIFVVSCLFLYTR